MPPTIVWTSSMCAKTLAAVTTFACPCFSLTFATAGGPKNETIVSIPFSSAIFDALVGSTPQTRKPASLKLPRSVPSFEPTSTTRSSLLIPRSGVASRCSSAKFSRRMRVVPLVYG